MFELATEPLSTPRRFSYDLATRATPERAFEVITCGDDEDWFPGYRRHRWLTPPGEGAVRVYELWYMSIVECFTEWRPGRGVTFHVSHASLPLLAFFRERYAFERVGGGTRVRWDIEYLPHPHAAWLEPLLRPVFALDFGRAARAVVSVMEGSEAGGPVERLRRSR